MNNNLSVKAFDHLDLELNLLKEKNRHRILNTIQKNGAAELHFNGKLLINMASNDYLGMSQKFSLKWAAAKAVLKYGSGSGASRLMSGNHSLYDALESEIARLKQAKAAIVFPTGYMANMGVLTAILDSNDLIILDRSCHASLVQGAKLSGAKLWVYAHNEPEALENLLQKAVCRSFSKILVVTESLFSMNGDIVKLPEIVSICKKYKALLMLDEAHATGVLGKHGQGACEHFNIPSNEVDILMGTLSKALGSLGGFIAGKENLIDYLRNKSKPFIYTTGLPPASVAACIQAIRILENSKGILLNLRSNIQFFREGLGKLGISTPESITPIFPVIFGSDAKTLEAARIMQEQGIYVPAVRPPTVPENESLLRFSILGTHSKKHLEQTLSAVQKIKSQMDA